MCKIKTKINRELNICKKKPIFKGKDSKFQNNYNYIDKYVHMKECNPLLLKNKEILSLGLINKI